MIGHRVDPLRPVSVLDGMSFLAGEPFELEALPGGLTNRNYRVTTASGRDYVARFSGAKSDMLAINRDAEAFNSAAAASIGAGPDVVQYAPEQGVLVVNWIEGRTLVDRDLDDDVTLNRVADACRQLHRGPRFSGEFDMFAVQRHYLDIVVEHGFRLPDDYLDFVPQVRALEQVLRASSAGTVPCHNDLLAANIMDGGERIWFIDYEYSGNNDPCFELGNIWSEANLPPDRLDQLVTSYYGERSSARNARARLFALMSKYGWTLWASIQNAVSDVDFDFWQWGLEKYARAVAEFRSPTFDRLVEAVQESINKGAPPWPTQSS